MLATFEVPTLILLLCLIVTTARSAWLLREIEQGQPDIALLPPNKMVVQDVPENMMMMRAAVVGNIYVSSMMRKQTPRATE